MATDTGAERLRRVVLVAMALNLGYFGAEFAVAHAIGSVSLFADSIDFLEDASINFLIFAALGWSAAQRARVGMLLAGILLIPGLATLWTAWQKFNLPVVPDPTPMMRTGMAGLAEFERDLIRERVRSGLAAAKARGVVLGRQEGQRPLE